MPIVSDASHHVAYIQPPDFDTRLQDVKQVIVALLRLDISPTLKYDMLVHAIWEVTKLQGSFRGRYRSKGVMVKGVKIQRDHVFQKGRIVRRLLANPDQVEDIVDEIKHCVVTKEEHDQLTAYSKISKDVDGWERYKLVGIEVMDMANGEQLI